MSLLERIPKPMLSFLCQGLVSGVSFAASLAVLHYGRHGDYTAYVLVINTYMLLSSLLNALLLQPLITLSARMNGKAIAWALEAGSVVGLVLGLLGTAGLLSYTLMQNEANRSALPLAAVAICFCLLLFRDVQRTGWLLSSDLSNLLKLDSAYCLCACLIMIGAAGSSRIDMRVVLYAISLPALVGLAHRVRGPQTDGPVAYDRIDRAFRLAVWRCSRWALPGVAVTWLFNSGYWFFLNSTQGKLAVAALAASRLAFTPIGLVVQGWAGYFRPVFSRLEHAGQFAEKQRIIRRQNVYCVVIVLGFTLLLALGGELAPRFLPAYLQGGNWQAHVWAWGGYFAMQWIRMVRSTACLANAAGFRSTFNAGALGCAVFYLLLLPSAWFTRNPVICPLLLIVCEMIIYFALGRYARLPVAQTA